MSQLVLYFLHSTSVLSFDIDLVLTHSILYVCYIFLVDLDCLSGYHILCQIWSLADVSLEGCDAE